MVQENCELPWDVFDIISKTLDLDDHFQFAGVCKNWRAFHKIYSRNFMASQEPLLLQISCQPKGSFSFVSIPDQKVYCSKMGKYFFRSAYVTISSGYFIMAGYNDNSFMLMNPFTRIKKVVNTPTSKVKGSYLTRRALLAFGKCSEEFVLVVLCNYCLYVYQSRNLDWVAYSRMEDPEGIVDFVVLHNIIYVVTNKANIGVLSLNFARIKFLKLKSTPGSICFYTRLLNCDGQLLVVGVTSNKICNIYKIDFSTMNYVKLETLGDIALFYVSYRSCYALSNPNRWGYESNSVYIINSKSTRCSVYLVGDTKLQKHITLSTPDVTSSFKSDWCFRHQHFEVDYSLVE